MPRSWARLPCKLAICCLSRINCRARVLVAPYIKNRGYKTHEKLDDFTEANHNPVIRFDNPRRNAWGNLYLIPCFSSSFDLEKELFLLSYLYKKETYIVCGSLYVEKINWMLKTLLLIAEKRFPFRFLKHRLMRDNTKKRELSSVWEEFIYMYIINIAYSVETYMELSSFFFNEWREEEYWKPLVAWVISLLLSLSTSAIQPKKKKQYIQILRDIKLSSIHILDVRRNLSQVPKKKT